MNVAVDARVSEKPDNANQLDQLRKLADRQGWAAAVEYVDTVTGSGRKTRPQLERMLLAASQRESTCYLQDLLRWFCNRVGI